MRAKNTVNYICKVNIWVHDMDPPYYLIAVGIMLLGAMIPYSVLRARRSKEKAYYMGGVVSALTLLVFISICFLQLVFAIVFVAAAFIISVVSLPMINAAVQREADKQRRETNVAEPLKARELLTWRGWYKLAFRWGIPKTMGLYLTFNLGILIPTFLALSIVGLHTIAAFISAAIVVVVFIVQFYQQMKKIHFTPQGNTENAPLAESSA